MAVAHAPLLEVSRVSKLFGGVQAVREVSFRVERGTVKALIGPNGAGKTTLFNLVSGHLAPDAGEIRLRGAPIQGRPPHRIAALGLSRTFQSIKLFGHMTALENVMVGRHVRSRAGMLSGMLSLPATRREERDIERRALEALELLGAAALAHQEARGRRSSSYAFGREESHAASVDVLSRAMANEQQRLTRASALGGALASLGADLTAVAVLALAVPAVRSGALDGVHLAVVTLIALAAFEAVAALPAAWQGAGAMRESARRLFEVVDRAPAVAEPVAPASAAPPPACVLETRDVRFAYPGEPRLALDGVNLRLETGRRVAVVGASGSGKSTLVHLITVHPMSPPQFRGTIRHPSFFPF